MSLDLNAVRAVECEQFSLSLKDLLQSWKVRGQLHPLLHQAIEDRLIEVLAQKEGIEIQVRELQEAADRYRQQHGLQRSEATREWLQEKHLTLEDFEASFARSLRRRKLAEKVTADQIERYFAEHRTEFDQARLSQILVEKEGVADELCSQIKEDGADFALLARAHSIDPESKQAGGYLGILSRDDMPSIIEAAVFGAKAGEVLGPFQTREGFHLVRVEEILSAELKQAREIIRDRLFTRWLEEKKSQAQIQELIWDLLGQ